MQSSKFLIKYNYIIMYNYFLVKTITKLIFQRIPFFFFIREKEELPNLYLKQCKETQLKTKNIFLKKKKKKKTKNII